MKRIILLLTICLSSLFAGGVSTYLYTNVMPQATVKSTLSSNGFDIVGEYDAMENKDYHIIVYSSAELRKLASKKDRAFAAVQKVMINNKNNQLILTNPDYFGRAFMQDDLDENLLATVNSNLNKAFGNSLKGGDDSLNQNKLSGYHFMMSMPYYEDMIEVAKGANLNEILKKNAKDSIVFNLKVGDAIVYGIAQNGAKGEKAYLSVIHQENKAVFLPYMVMVRDNKAYILHAKYNLAISLPKLTMGQFMTISGTPGDIEDYFKGLFKK